MGNATRTTGRILLPETSENHLLTVLEVRMSAHDGPFHPDRPVDSLDELARYAGARLSREGDWLAVVTDEEGAARWSDQAAAFYRGLEGWVTQGDVIVTGEDGSRWGYRYSSDGLIEAGRPGDGVVTPTAARAAHGSLGDEPPAASTGPAGPAGLSQPSVPPLDEPPAPPSPESYLAAYPHLRDDDATSPPGGGRTLLMVLLLVVGVVAIIGVALLASGVA